MMKSRSVALIRQELADEIRKVSTSVRQTSYLRVHNIIRRDIITGRIASGSRLKATELAQMYDISPVPIREALQKLAGEGLVTITPNRGAWVRGVDESFILQLHDMRCVLASHISAKSVVLMTAAVLERLVIIQDLYEEYVELGELESIIAANSLFHWTLDSFARNEVIAATIENHLDLLRTLRLELGFSDERKDSMAKEHRELIEAAHARNAQAAAEIVKRHVSNGCEDFVRQMRARAAGWLGAARDGT